MPDLLNTTEYTQYLEKLRMTLQQHLHMCTLYLEQLARCLCLIFMWSVHKRVISLEEGFAANAPEVNRPCIQYLLMIILRFIKLPVLVQVQTGFDQATRTAKWKAIK